VLVRGVVLGRVRRWWGGAGSGPLSLPLVGWCWAIVIIRGVVLGHCPHRWWGDAGPLSSLVGWCCRHWWGGAGPGSLSPMLGVVMGHRLGGWWWALVAVRVDTLPLRSIVVMVAIRPSLSCCVGLKSDDE